MATSVVFPRVQFFANNGRPLIGGRIHTYVAGSSTRARTYKDAAKAQPNANPIILDARGEASVYLAEGVEYKFVIEDSQGALIMTQEPVYGAVWPNAAEWPSDATLSYQYMTEAKAAVDSMGITRAPFDTYAQALSALPGLANGERIEVSIDETRSNARTRYKVEGGALVFVVNLDQVRLDLANAADTSKGAAMVAFQGGGPGAVSRTLASRLADALSVKDYGAVGDGVVDDTAAIQAAVTHASTSGGAGVYLPPGTYKINGTIEFPDIGISMFGAGMQATRIINYSLAAATLNLNLVGRSHISDLSIEYISDPLTGAIAIRCHSSAVIIDNIYIDQCDIGIDFQIGAGMAASNVWIDRYKSIGIRCKNVGDVYCANIIMDAKNSTNGALGGLRLEDKAEAINFTNCAILNGVYSITTDAAVYGNFTRPAYCKFVSVYCDSAAQGGLIDKMVETSFTNCWFSGGRSGAGFPGLTLNTTDSITINGGTSFFNCGSHGLLVNTGSERTIVHGCFFESNSVTAGPAVAHGVSIGANVSNFQLIGNTARNGMWPGGQQGYGFLVNSGNSSKYIIKDNNGDGCATGTLSDGGNGDFAIVRDNIGYNPRGASSVAVGPSPFDYKAGHCSESVYISGGEVGLIIQKGVAIASGTSHTINLEPNEEITINYTVAPYVNKMVH